MRLSKYFFSAREWLVQLPQYLYYWLFWWLYPTTFLRCKVALCPYPRVRELMLRRSGIRMGIQVRTNLGMLVIGRGKRPPAVEIGDRVAVGPYVTFVTSSYPHFSRLGEHPEVQGIINRFGPIRVEDDAWIGAGVVILPNVTIGRGAVIGAGAVVTQDVPPGAVVAGIPARVIRYLLSPETVA